MVLSMTGCVSLDDHNRLLAAHRNLTGQKESLEKELFDARSVVDALKSRGDACERELKIKDELLANLRGENTLLDEMFKQAKGELTDLAGRDLGDIHIEGPKLPAPLDSALKGFADQHPSEVEYDPARGSVKWKADLLFALGSDVVRESSMGALQQFSAILNSPAASGFEVLVVGHTDNQPIARPETKAKHPTNWHLSAHRSIAVSNMLQKFGYAPDRVGVMGCGEYRPVTANSNEEGKSKNRRVDIYLVPKASILYSDRGLTTGDARLALAPR